MRQLCSCIISFEYKADRSTLKAKQVIEHYNWIWSEMTPTKGKIKGGSTTNFTFRGGLCGWAGNQVLLLTQSEIRGVYLQNGALRQNGSDLTVKVQVFI